jgi:hypothetical protein
MARADIRSGALRGVLLTLAVMALVMRVAVPQGFMTAPTVQGGLELVICTGHGPLKTGPSAPAEKPRPEAACAFAGHGAGTAPEPLATVETIAFASPAEPARLVPADVAPGRGLAAPPPPSLGPPLTV